MIKIKSATQIEQMKKAGALSKMALRHVGAMVRPGVSTFELDQLAEQIIRMHGGTPAFKGYGGSGPFAHRSTMPWSTVFPTPT